MQIRQRRGSVAREVPNYPQASAKPSEEEKLESEILALQDRRKKHLQQDVVYQTSRRKTLSESVLKNY